MLGVFRSKALPFKIATGHTQADYAHTLHKQHLAFMGLVPHQEYTPICKAMLR